MASWIVRDGIISFSSVGFLFFFFHSEACLWWGISSPVLRAQEYSDICMQFWCQAPQMEPIGSVPLVMAGWQTVAQSALNAHFLLRSLVNCSSSTIGHYPVIDSQFVQDSAKSIWKPSSGCCVRQEASVLAHRVIHSVSCTQRGLSSLVSLLLAFRECACVCVMCTHMQEFARVCAHACICPCSNTG